MASNTPVDVDAKELKRAQDMWAGFSKLLFWSCISSAVVLSLMALFLL